jgi:hypothetical protein
MTPEEFIEHISGESTMKMEPVGTLSPKDQKIFDGIRETSDRLMLENDRNESRFKTFMANLRLANPDLMRRRRVVIENNVIMASVDEAENLPLRRALPQSPELPEMDL